MARRPVTASFVLGSLALVVGQGLVGQGCTQDFSTFDATGSGGAASTSTTTSTTTGTTTTTTTGPGAGGDGPTTTGGGSNQGGGGAGPCSGAADCDDANPCTTDTCGPDGACVNEAVADGPIGGVDDPEDCQNHDCVAGVVVDEADDTEDPTDANPPCELTVCSGGEPTPDFADAGVSCGPSPQACDGAGTCRGCDPAPPDNECGADTACSSPTCLNTGVCDPGFLDDTTPLDDPTAGDCQKDECPGNAVNPVSVDDDTDEPNNLPCAVGACDNGAPVFNTVDEGTACFGQPGVCDGAGNNAANCKVCRDTAANASVDAGCSAGAPICDETAGGGAGACRACNDTAVGSGTDLGCSSAQVCDPSGTGTCVDCYTDGSDVAINCNVDEVCEPGGAGTCRTCYDVGDDVTDPGCDAALPACDEGNDTCVECQASVECAGNKKGPNCTEDNGTTCGCQNNPDCATSNQGHVCRSGAGPDVCGCNGMGDCSGINGATACTGNVCMCGANPC